MRRRTLLASGAGLAVAFLPGCGLPVIPSRPAPAVADAMSWIRHEAGRYVLSIPRAEMGQNILTGLKQIACCELGVEWSQVEARLHGSHTVRPVRSTVGSESIKDYALPLAQACATLRDAVQAGRTQGVLVAEDRPYASLRAFQPAARFVGQAVPVEQAHAIVRGGPLYPADARPPGCLFGCVLRADASPGLPSRLLGFDEAAARAVPGFVAVVRDDRLQLAQAAGVGVVAATPGALARVAAALAPRWQVEGSFEQADLDPALDIDARLARGALAHDVDGGSVDTALPWDVDLRIDIPLAAHAPIQPRAAVAAPLPGGGLEVWVGSQDVFYQRDVIAKRCNLAPDSVRVHGMRMGGSFGGKTICTVELEAALLALAANAPVKVQWSRAQEFQLGFHRPASSHRIRARLKDGRIDGWWHAFSSSNILFTNAVLPPWLQRLTAVVGDDGVARGAALAYAARQRRIQFDLVQSPVLTGPWRGLGAGPNHLAIESAVDELACRAGADPLAFRLAQASHPRLRAVLQAVGQRAGWAEPRPAAEPGWRRGRGVACGIYKAGSYAAVVAEVAVSAAGDVRVLHMVCAHDCGLVVNPDQVRAQCEGNLVWGIGMVLSDRLPVRQGAIAASTLADAPIPRMADVPRMEVQLVDHGDRPSGAGETAIVAAAGAVANAIRQATGVRPTRFPVGQAVLRA